MAETNSDTVLRLESIIKDNFPDVDIAPSTVFSELVVKMAAYLQNPIINNIDELNQGKAIADVLAATTDTFNPIVDGIASNYNTSRGEGKRSVGKIKIIVSSNRVQFLREGFIMAQPVLKLNYVTTTAYRVTSNPTEATDIQLVQSGAQFYFILPVEAEEVGSEYQVANGAKFSLGTGSVLNGFVDASAYGSFTGGLPADTDKELIAKYQQGISNKSLLTQKSILFRLAELYPNVRDISVIGASDEEMTRCKQNLFGVSTLGTTDVYIRSSLGPETTLITKTATKNTAGDWEVTLDKDDVPGFYRVVSIVPSGEDVGGTLLFEETFDYSTAGIVPSNLLNNVQEARFTKYQTCDLVITYSADSSTATEQDFDILVSYQPNLADIQDLFLNNDERIACADYLVKAALPCFVSVALRLHRKNTSVDLPTDQIKQDIFNYINTLKFGDSLYASELVNICHNYDVKHVQLPLTLTGVIIGTDGEKVTVTGTDKLEIPTDLTVGISPKTTLFFADYFRKSDQETMSESIDIEVS